MDNIQALNEIEQSEKKCDSNENNCVEEIQSDMEEKTQHKKMSSNIFQKIKNKLKGQSNLELRDKAKTKKLIQNDNLKDINKNIKDKSYYRSQSEKILQTQNKMDEILDIIQSQNKKLNLLENALTEKSSIISDDVMVSEKKVIELLSDQTFLEKYILQNKSIEEQIILRYIKSLKSGNAPKLIDVESQIAIAKTPPPKTIGEAGELAKKALKFI